MSILTMYTLIGALTVLCTWSSASAQNRLALLIGNQTYTSAVGALKNPHQDIGLIDKALRHVGFSVTSKRDLSRNEIRQSVRAFAKLLGNAGDAVGFFYYSGHGVADPDSQANYLIPTDVKNMEDSDVWDDSVPLDEILTLLGRYAPRASHFVIFDACRTELRLPVKSAVKGFVQPIDKNGMFLVITESVDLFPHRSWSLR